MSLEIINSRLQLPLLGSILIKGAPGRASDTVTKFLEDAEVKEGFQKKEHEDNLIIHHWT